MEAWKSFVNESSFDARYDRGAASSTFNKKMFDDFEGFAQSMGGDPAIGQDLGPEGQYILANARLNIMGEVVPVARRSQSRIDKDFLIAWVTGRLASYGGPDIEKAQRLFGDHTDAKLFTKFKNYETKHDFGGPEQAPPPPSPAQDNQRMDHPADGMKPMDPSHASTHEGGVEPLNRPQTHPAQQNIPTPVPADRVLPALKALVTKDFSTPSAQQDVRRVLKTLIHALESQGYLEQSH